MKLKAQLKLTTFFSILVISTSCSNKHIIKALSPMEKTKLTIVGIEHNSKAGAMLLTDKNEVFYIAELDEWNDQFYEKKVKVSGFINTENFKEEELKNKKGEWVQGMIGDKHSILEA